MRTSSLRPAWTQARQDASRKRMIGAPRPADLQHVVPEAQGEESVAGSTRRGLRSFTSRPAPSVCSPLRLVAVRRKK